MGCDPVDDCGDRRRRSGPDEEDDIDAVECWSRDSGTVRPPVRARTGTSLSSRRSRTRLPTRPVAPVTSTGRMGTVRIMLLRFVGGGSMAAPQPAGAVIAAARASPYVG